MKQSTKQTMEKQSSPPFDGDAAKRAVVKVGDGRGFIMETTRRIHNDDLAEIRSLPQGRHKVSEFIKSRIIVTAAHCLDTLPPADPCAPEDEKTYKLLGLLGSSKPSIMASCLFVDPVADVAVLGMPDGEIFEDADTAFGQFVEGQETLRLGNITQDATGWLLSLSGQWNPCTVCRVRTPFSVHFYPANLLIANAEEGIIGGMSGSPILLDDGTVIGVLSTTRGTSEDEYAKGGGPQPWLRCCLPAVLVEQISTARSRRPKS